MKTTIVNMFGAALLMALCQWPMVGDAQTAQPTTLNIPAQPLRDALTALGRQTGLQVIYTPAEVTAALNAPPVVGTFTAQDALGKLLANTGLRFEYLDARTVAIRLVKAGEGNSSSGLGPADQMRVADGAPTSKGSSKSSESEENQKNQVVVEGERDRPKPFSTANLDLTRTEDDPLPFTVFTAEEIRLSGASSLQEFFRNRLTQNFDTQIPEEMDGGLLSATSRMNRIDFRGWGETETIILLNGRRLGPQYQGVEIDTSNATPNLRGIPLNSIERIEILSSAGSAIYGADATGGVINIITRQDFRGGQMTVSYETPSDVHAPRRSVDLTYGLPLPHGFGLRVSASYGEIQPLHAGDRGDVTIERWRKVMMERQPSRLITPVQGNPFRTGSLFYGATTNIRAISTSIAGKPGNLFADLPGAQASNFTSVPEGYAGGGGLSAFQPGVYNLGMAEGSAGSLIFARGSALGADTVDTVLGLGADRSFGEQWRWSVDYRYAENESEGHSNGVLGSSPLSVVPAAAPTNPFGQDVLVRLIDPRLQRSELMSRSRNTTWELSSTLRGAIGEWRGFFDVSYSGNSNTSRYSKFIEPNGGWNQVLLDGRYNPFVDVRTVAPASSSFYENYIATRSFYGSATRNLASALKASGPVFPLPAGQVQLTAGLDWTRSDRYRAYSVSQFQDGPTGEPRIPTGQTSDLISEDDDPRYQFKSDTYAVYAEASIPVFSAANAIPLVRQLELFGSGRLNHTVHNGRYNRDQGGEPFEYTDTAHVYAFGLRHEFLEGFAFRISQSVGFNPPYGAAVSPTPTEWYYPPDFMLPVFDPRRGEEALLSTTGFSFGGNPDLKPETTVSTNVGLAITPRWVPGMRLSLDYLESIRNDAIFDLANNIDETLGLEAELPGRIQRGAPDGHPSGVGPITALDLRYININEISSRSLDISIEQRLNRASGGQWVFSVTATKILSHEFQATPSSDTVERVRNRDFSLAQWNGNAQLRWETRQWGFSWNTRYFDYILAAPADYIFLGSDRAPRALNHDVSFSYQAAASSGARGVRSMLSGLSITGGIKNLFDREPRFWVPLSDGAHYAVAPYDSIMGRSVWLQLRRTFGD